ncbi:CBS domain-containing protein [Polaribacter glomeratus]|uniref:CBS domain-containing protein n=1 Tax=Polaribacter glomeratus TaxID=102 RepID=A0A2S7WVC7_9FLAO|nr:CBS domain-containing protein [Polaribacter glomeratus]PQJ81321.1 hypothetical protein BTO16_01440 [Polaribacter glomeratus]TXD64064.1 magnesium transporter [Polaribacter glomeratus]
MNVNQTILNDFIDKQPFAAAHTLDRMNSEEVALFMQSLPIEKSLKLISIMNIKKASECFLFLPTSKTKDLIEKGEPNFIASLLKLIEAPRRDVFLEKITSDKKDIIMRKMEHLPNTVGALMETALCVNKEMTVKEAINIIKNNKDKEEFYLYVIDLDRTLKGVVIVKDLLLADKKATLEDLIITSIPKIFPETQIKSVQNYAVWFDYRHIAVIDKSEKILGTLSYKKAMELTDENIDTSKNEVLETAGALGELYRIGLTGLLKSVGK